LNIKEKKMNVEKDKKERTEMAKRFATMAFVIAILMAVCALKGNGIFPAMFATLSAVFMAIGFIYSTALYRLNHG
jgi:hypothetical protein